MNTKSIEALVHIPVDSTRLEGMLEIPTGAKGMILFSHGSGSSRLSPRNNFVARLLRDHGFGTLLIDLLTREEDADQANRFNIGLLTDRLGFVMGWLKDEIVTKHLPLGLFGASTGAASALNLAARSRKEVFAVVSRGGRPDMADESLPEVHAPTLLIVGGEDDVVIELNQKAYKKLKCKKNLVIIPGASHLFEEPGTLESVAQLAAEWFISHLPKRHPVI